MGQSVVGPPTRVSYGRNAGPLGLRLCARSRRNRKYQGMLPHHWFRPRAALCAARTAAGERYSDSNGA
jgi:hypothetical protein